MKSLLNFTSLIIFFFFSLLLIFSTFSHADLHNSDHDDHDHDGSSYSLDRVTEDNTPTARTTQSSTVDLSHFVNRHPVRLTNRFPGFHRVLRFFPHRCRHHHHQKNHRLVPNLDRRQSKQWGPRDHDDEMEQDDDVVQFMFLKKNGIDQILQHRHVARSDHPDPIMFKRFDHYLIPARHRYRNHHHDHDDHDHEHDGHDDHDDHDMDLRSVVFKKESKGNKHRHHEDQKDNHDHHEHEAREDREKGVLNKIRKFLAYF